MGTVLDDRASAFEAILRSPGDQQASAVAAFVGDHLLSDARPVSAFDAEFRQRMVAVLERLVRSGEGSARERVMIGEALGWLGDPRLSTPMDAAYWVAVETDDGEVNFGRFLVTNEEFQRFVDSGAYHDDRHWSEAGLAWKAGCPDPWSVRAAASGSKGSTESSPSAESRAFIVPNQPVVGVTHFEAEAYANAVGARLPRFDERQCAVRGPEKRPYPWGSPFGSGNANTQEEALRRPCAVGLFLGDCTPEGVCDLAGNVGEWSADGAGHGYWVAPGAWDQPSMASWAKARELEPPESRSASLGFRLVRD